MSVTNVAAPVHRRTFLRVWFPVLAVALPAAAVAAFWLAPGDDMPRLYRVSATWIGAMLAGLLLSVWLVLLSPWSWWQGVLALAAVGAAAVGAVAEIHLTGDLAPVVRFRWQPNPDDVLAAHRRGQGGAEEESSAEAPVVGPEDWAEYRGPQRDGVVIGPALAADWQANPPRKLWRQPVGAGYASFAVAGDFAVTIEQRRDTEAVVCYDTANGRERWVHSYPAHFTEAMGGPGPRATPTIAGGRVYALGAAGALVCLDLLTGKAKWSVNILENNKNLAWGMSGSPLVYDDVVVVNPGAQVEAKQGQALAAYDRVSGERKPMWGGGSARAGYSSPMLATLAGKRQVLLFDGEGLAGHDAANGAELWRYPWTTHQGINVAQPVVLPGDRVFVSSGYGVGCALLRIANNGMWSAEPVWQNNRMHCRFTSPVLHEGHLYGLDEGILVCLDAETGDRKWKAGRYGHGQLLLTNGRLLILGEQGELALVDATPQGYRERTRFYALQGKTWNLPALAGGKGYVRNHREMACYDLAAPAER
jgi:outer membrane protein assembly factor BamB